MTLGLLLIIAPQAVGHPHMFLDTRLTIRMSSEGLQGIGMTWYFDPMFTAQVKMDFDVNRDGVFNAAETKAVYENAFSNLKNYDYFTYISWNGKMYPTGEVAEFAVRMEEGRLVYQFYIPFAARFEKEQITFGVAVYDKTFFCDVRYAEKDAAVLENARDFALTYEIRTNENTTITYDNSIVGASRKGATYTGIAHPMEVDVSIRRK